MSEETDHLEENFCPDTTGTSDFDFLFGFPQI